MTLTAATLIAATPAVAEGAKVGMITTLSGPDAAVGMDIRDGFLLALTRAGREEITLQVADDEGTPERAAEIADTMIQTDDVDVLTGIIRSDIAMAVVPAALAQGRFYLSPYAGPSELAGAGCQPNFFSLAWQNDNLHEAAGAYASETGYTNSFLLAPDSPAGTAAVAAYKRFYKGNIAGELFTQPDQTDYSAEIAQIRASGADSVFFFLPVQMSVRFLRQYAESAVGIPLIGPALSFDQHILNDAGGAALSLKNTAQWSKDLDNPANHAFVAAFRETYGRLPSLYAAQAYDTANLLISALDTADIDDPDSFRLALEKAAFDSVRGKFSFAPNHYPVQDIYVREVFREGDVLTNRILTKVLNDHGDAYGQECVMQGREQPAPTDQH